MSTNYNKIPLLLTTADKARLEKFAPLFDIEFHETSDGHYRLRIHSDTVAYEQTLPATVAHVRLLMEICERAVHWVHFHFAQSCRDSLLGLTDERIHRVAELYSLNRDARLAAVQPGLKGPHLIHQKI